MGEAVHGAAALQFIESQPVEMVITDMSMPIMNGVELTAAIKRKYPDIMIVALSAYDDFKFVKESLKLGARDYILKQDIEKEDISQIVQNSWNKHMAELRKDSQLNEGILSFLHGDKTQKRAEKYLQLCMEDNYGYCLCIVKNLNLEWNYYECQKTDWFKDSFFEVHDKREHLLLFSAKMDASLKVRMEQKHQKINEIENMLKNEEYLAGFSSLIPDAAHL